jgi:nitroreductase
METLEAIRTKRAVRQFTSEPVPDEVIEKILDAGRRAQSSKNSQPWHFVLIKDRERLKELSQCGRYAEHIADSAFTVVILQTVDWAFDIGQAAAYMQLAAWDLGVSSGLASLHDQECAQKVVQAPADLNLQIAIAFGYAANPPHPPKPGGRRKLDQIVHPEVW